LVGKTLGHYEILEPLGKGGMGEVYRARDTKLDRDVAIKVLPPDMAADPERLARFEREAKAVAALDHPNIVMVHSVEEADDCHFITMQLVEGTTLTELIPPQGLSVEKLLPLERFGEKKATNLINAIEARKDTTLGRFIYGLGIRHVGEHVAKVLAQEFGDIGALMDADVERLAAVHEIGPGSAESVVQFFAESHNRSVVEGLLAAGVTPRVEERNNLFDGERFVITGALERWSRDEIGAILESAGGRMSSSVSKQTAYVVVGGKPGSKAREAEELGVPVLDEDGLVALLREKGVSFA